MVVVAPKIAKKTQPMFMPMSQSTIKTITVGDVHGSKIWQKCADLKILMKFPNLETEYDKYIFIGDYTDSFTHSDKQIIDNLRKIITLKRNYPDKVILLWGNHDLQYLFSYQGGHGCSGYRTQMYTQLHDIFQSNKELFQTAFQIKNYLWTHAGVHKGWYKNRFSKIIHNSNNTLAEQLNELLYRNAECLFDVGYARGGYQTIGGPFWLDKIHLNKPLEGYHQITGHSKVKYIRTDKFEKDTSVTFTDCLDTIESFYKLEIKS